MVKPASPSALFDKLQGLRSLACVVYDRAMASGMANEEMLQALAPVQDEYKIAMHAGIDSDLDGSAAAIEMFEAQAEAQAKYAAEIMEKAKDLRQAAQELREALAASMDANGEEKRAGKLYAASLIEGIGEGGRRSRQIVLR